MKKFLLIVVIAGALLLVMAVSVTADNGPHGGFSATTDSCASCHRAHSAKSTEGAGSLLIASSIDALCISCHSGTGAGTDVMNGVYKGTTEGVQDGPLFAGGFNNALMSTAWTGNNTFNAAIVPASRQVTSRHDLDVSGKLWGAGLFGAASAHNGETMTMECTSCHDPHGNAGYVNATPVLGKESLCDPTVAATNPCTKRANSYRLLRWRPQGSNGFTPPSVQVNWSGGAFPTNGTETGWTVPDNFLVNGQEWYTLGTTGRFAVADYSAGSTNSVYSIKNPAAAGTNYVAAAVNVAYFCAQCHDRYFTSSALRNTGDPSLYCGTREAIPAQYLAGATLEVIAPDPVTNLHPTKPTECIAARWETARLSGIFYDIWGDARGTGDATFTYMHTSGDIRAAMDGTLRAGAGTSLSRSCVACHVAHGTASEMTVMASDATLAKLDGDDVNNSTLLRMDNRSTCLRCHTSAVGFTAP